MSVLGLAILGKKNEPMYLCDTVRLVNSKEVDSVIQNISIDNNNNNNNANNTISTTKSVNHGTSLSLNNQLIMYAALDCFDEVVDTQNGLMPVLRSSSSTISSGNNTNTQQQQHPHWLGLLYCVSDADGPAVYGYVTATNIKFFILLSKYEKTRLESTTLKGMVADIHQSYISYVMNPFNQLDGTIHSNQFDIKIKNIITEYYTKSHH